LYDQLIENLKAFRKISFRWIPREQNYEADALSREAYQQTQNEKRKERGEELVKDVVKIEDNLFKIKGKEYVINLYDNNCTCPDFVKRRRRCKHLWAVLFATEALT
jgi:ribonuclease HI